MQQTPHPALEALLASEPALWRGERRDAPPDPSRAALPSGYAALDAALPGGGWCAGGVTELLIDTHGIGELSLLLPALRALTRAGRWAALINPPHLPYAPALANAGLGLDRLLLVDSARDEDALWAAEQLLRDGAVALLALWVERTTPARQRRLQLAAERGRAVAVVYRPGTARAEHSPVVARVGVVVRDGCLALDLFKVRGGRAGAVTIEPAAFDEPQGAEWPLLPDAALRRAAAPD